jgi:transcriptional regulator GlxA family with amidase domain
MNAEILLFEGFDELDAIGPYEVLRAAGAVGGTADATLVTHGAVDAVEANHGARVQPHGRLGETALDILVVPGGGWNDRSPAGARTEYERGTIPDAIADLHTDGVTVASVCTGAMLLSKAGLLTDRPATTHHGALADLRTTDADVREERVVDHGDVLTSGGVTAGIDLALHLVERECGRDVADAVAAKLEHERAI